jgi:hypothetical protein
MNEKKIELEKRGWKTKRGLGVFGTHPLFFR